MVALAAEPLWGQEILPQPPVHSALLQATSNRVHKIYIEARRVWRSDRTNAQAAWQFGRACFDRAEFTVEKEDRAAYAEQGIAACRKAIVLKPDAVGAHYYLGLNLGQLARTRMWSALKMLKEMEAVWKHSISLDAGFDNGGAHRSLGLLYFEAPGWPLSLGSRSKGLRHMKKAAELHPNYPGNRLAVAEAQLKVGKMRDTRALVPLLEETFATARTNLVGERWDLDWKEWEERLRKVKEKTGEGD